MISYFRDIPLGLFRSLRTGLVYTKINDTQAVIITNGKTIDFDVMEEVLLD